MTTLQKIHKIEDEGNLNSTMTQENMSFKESESLRHFIKLHGIKPLIMWFSATFLYCYQFFLRTSPSVMEDVLRQEFQMNAQSFGLLASFYYIAYSVLQIPMGVLIDKIGLRRILTFSAAMCSLGALVFGISDGHALAKIGRLFMGIGSAGVFLSCLKLITLWFPKRKFGIFVGFTMMMGTFGAMGAQTPLAFMIEALGWRMSLICMSGLGALWAVLLWCLVKDRKAPLGLKSEEKPIPLLIGLRRIITNSQIWLAALYGTTMYTVLSSFSDLWGPAYLMKAYHIDKPLAGLATSALLLGVAIGGPFFGYISERLKSRKLPMLIAAVGSLFFFCLFLYTADLSLTAIFIFLFLVGFFVGGKLMNFAVGTDSVPYSLSGTATGFINACSMTSGVMFQPFIGWLMHQVWDGSVVNGIPTYTAQNYVFGLSVIPICMFLAVGITLMTRESYPK
ncbi:MAG: MFS transporter [Proteobacteria bacterium]|nr:MFS transporter [Pseudomonadota bacterium]